MKRKFRVQNLKTISVNQMYTTKRFITQNYSEWLQTVKFKLDNELDMQSIRELKNFYNPKIHKIHVHIIAQYSKFYNKQGEISAHTHDVTNFEKACIDVLFDEKHLDIANDKNITKMISEKMESKDSENHWECEVEILPR